MFKRIGVAILVVGGLLLTLPALEEPKDLEFEAYATIQAKPREAERGDNEIFLAALRLAIKDPEEARGQLEDIAASESEFAAEARELASAVRAAQIEGNEAYTFTLLGQSLARLEAWQLSLQALEQAVGLNPSYAEAWAYLGEAYQHTGDDDKALNALQRAAALNPLSLAANLFQAFYWQRQGDYDAAFRHLQIAHLIEPANPQMLVDLGRNQVLAGKVLEARSFYLRAVELEPENVIWWKQLARYALANEVFMEETGLPAAQKTLSLTPEDAEARYLVAGAYWQLGESRALVLSFLEAALELDSNYAEANLLKSIVHLEAGESELARVHLERVLEGDASPSMIAQAETLLLQIGGSQ